MRITITIYQLGRTQTSITCSPSGPTRARVVTSDLPKLCLRLKLRNLPDDTRDCCPSLASRTSSLICSIPPSPAWGTAARANTQHAVIGKTAAVFIMLVHDICTLDCGTAGLHHSSNPSSVIVARVQTGCIPRVIPGAQGRQRLIPSTNPVSAACCATSKAGSPDRNTQHEAERLRVWTI